MITHYVAKDLYRGLSTDTKPTDGVANGEMWEDIDGGARYCFDAASKSWEAWDEAAEGSSV